MVFALLASWPVRAEQFLEERVLLFRKTMSQNHRFSHAHSGIRAAFTLIELLVVIAIIAILAALLFPVFNQAKNSGKQTVDLTQAKQIGIATNLYMGDHDDAMPLYAAYNSVPRFGQPGHRGTTDAILPYARAKDIFKSSFDVGGPALAREASFGTVPPTTYFAAYGTSYKFTTCLFSIAPGYSMENNGDPYNRLGRAVTITSKITEDPAKARIIRSEMLPWFSPAADPGCVKYGYGCDAPYDYYRAWNSTGGQFVFMDSHAKTATSGAAFDDMHIHADGHRSGDANSSSWSGTWYGLCD
jgi:prepilin-type N-terminal cleavage/methylation domain-containing protein